VKTPSTGISTGSTGSRPTYSPEDIGGDVPSDSEQEGTAFEDVENEDGTSSKYVPGACNRGD
jgi:hypothetical protein